MKKILLSVLTIALVATVAIGATRAYFTDAEVVSGNTFSTGTVKIGDMSSVHLNVLNLEPGSWTGEYNMNIPYQGSLKADLYIGVDGTSTPAQRKYIADELRVKITNKDTSTVIFNNFADYLSLNWFKIASSVNSGWKHYSVEFYLDPSIGNEKQGITNTDTIFYIYAVQPGYGAPGTPPHETNINNYIAP